MNRLYQTHKPDCNQHTCYCLDEELGDPMCGCGNPAWACRCEYIAEEADRYYDPTEAVVMVPVKVRYHSATDTVYSFECPTLEDVEKALKEPAKNLKEG